MSKATDYSTTMTRRAALAGISSSTVVALAGGAAAAALAISAGVVASTNAAASVLAGASSLATRGELLCRYDAWLHMERRLLVRELYPDFPEAEQFVPCDRHINLFYFPMSEDGKTWQTIPGPSTRVAAILDLAGVYTGPDSHDAPLAWIDYVPGTKA
jgi:hypothetical protein